MWQTGVLFALLGVLGAAGDLAPPRCTFLLSSVDRPLRHFKDVQNTTTLLLSDDGSTLFVGARDAILSLDVSQPGGISMKRKVEWKPSPEDIQQCRDKGKNEMTDCPNFVRVLQSINATHLYACGSYAYNPQDMYIDTDTLNMVRVSSNMAKVRCPFNPSQRNTAITVDGELFTGTTTDFRGLKPEIARHLSKDRRPDVSQDSSTNLLDDPTFVSSSSDPEAKKIYFFFTESGKEYTFMDELRVSRVAQVCKDDVGGKRTLQRRWTSFTKAHLLCQAPKELPFNILQDMFPLPPPAGDSSRGQLLFGIFTSQWSMGSGQSAVCVFQLDDVKKVFAGNYKNSDMSSNQWSPIDKNFKMGECNLTNAPDAFLAEVKRHFLTSDSVKPADGAPVLISSSQRYSRVAALRTPAASGKEYVVLFLLTESGFLHKAVLLDKGPHIIEEIQVFTLPQLMKSILLSSSKGVVYVGTSDGVTEVPVSNCMSYQSCAQCVLARDPLCGWDRVSHVCTRLPAIPTNIGQDVESGNVAAECVGSDKAAPVPVQKYTQQNEVVRLRCSKPSKLATADWTTPEHSTQNHYMQLEDDTLVFLAAPETLGIYHCVSVEDGHKEIVTSYDVRQRVSPRSFVPQQVTSGTAVMSVRREISTDSPRKSESIKAPMATTREPRKYIEEEVGTEPISVLTQSHEEDMGFEPTMYDYLIPTNKDMGSDLIPTDEEEASLDLIPANREILPSTDPTEPISVLTQSHEEDMGFEPTMYDYLIPTNKDMGSDLIPTDEEEASLDLIPANREILPSTDPTEDLQSRHDQRGDTVNSDRALSAKNYHSELVVVSLLLAVSVCMLVLAGLYRRCLRGTYKPNILASEDRGGNAEASQENVPTLCQDESELTLAP